MVKHSLAQCHNHMTKILVMFSFPLGELNSGNPRTICLFDQRRIRRFLLFALLSDRSHVFQKGARNHSNLHEKFLYEPKKTVKTLS